MADTRLILAVSVDDLPDSIANGFTQLTDSNVLSILEDADTWFGPRDTLENFDAYRQLIPYVVCVVGDKIVSYVRQPKGGESRLHGKISFGLGGHIDLGDAKVDAEGKFSIEDTLYAATERELDEELDISLRDEGIGAQQVGLISLSDTPVDQVHLGVVSILRLDDAPLGAEDEIGEIRLMTIEDLLKESDRLENWSKILLPHLNTLVGAAPLYGIGG